MPLWTRIATGLLLGSLATLFFKKPTLFYDRTNLNDLLLAFSFLAFMIAVLQKEIRLRLPRWVAIGGSAGFFFLLLATMLSYRMHHTLAPDAIREYVRAIAAAAAGIETYALARQYPKLIPPLLGSIAASSLLLPFMVYAPGPARAFFLDDSSKRFTGFLTDPNYYSAFEVVPVMLLLWIGFERPFGTKRVLSMAAFALSLLAIGSIVWSGSRGSILGLAAGIIVLAACMVWKLPKREWLRRLAVIGLICASFFFLLPRQAQYDVRYRATTITETGTGSAIPNLAARQGRSAIWKSALGEIRRNPLGYGPDYGPTADIQGDNDDHHRVAHNTVLQILLTGGIGLFALMLAGMWQYARLTMRKRAPFGALDYVQAALAATCVAGLFVDSLWSRWIWVLIAVALALATHEG